MIVLDLSILNQKGTPMFNSDLTANRPAAGIVGRIFIATDSPYGIFRDTGTAWDQISSAGGATIYTADGTLTGNRTVSSGGFSLTFTPQTTFFSSLTASTSASSFSVLGSNALTFAVGFSSSNIGNVYGANGAINAQNFLGNATFAQANLASAMVNVNKIDFGSGGHTITMTQSTAPGIRAMTGVQNQIQFTGSHNGTISHAAISQNLGFFRESGSTRTLTITNAYSLLINPLDDYGAGFTFTNRWGIYQAGVSDTNYFAANSLFGTTTNAGFRVDIAGTARVQSDFLVSNQLRVNSGRVTLQNNFTGGQGLYFADNGGNLATGYKFADFGAAQQFALYNSGNLFLLCNVAGTALHNWTNAGNVNLGYGTTDIGNRLSVNGNTLITGTSRFDNILTNTAGGIVHSSSSPTNDAFYTLLSGVVRFSVNANGYCKSTSSLIADINGSGSVNASAILQADSTTKGFLPPRMTTAQINAIASPAEGLLVYNTTISHLCCYQAGAWAKFSHSPM